MARTQRPKNQFTTQIGTRLIDALLQNFGLSMTQAATALGYANATTLHKIRSGKALPDPSRLAKFAREQSLIPKQTLNLHWILTGQGNPLIDRKGPKTSGKKLSSIDIDIINSLSQLDPQIKQAVRVLVLARSTPQGKHSR